MALLPPMHTKQVKIVQGIYPLRGDSKLCNEYDEKVPGLDNEDFEDLDIEVDTGESLEDGEEVVEAILDHQKADDGTLEFKVKWQGWDENFSTWHDEEDLVGCEKLIKAYLKGIGGRKSAATTPGPQGEANNSLGELQAAKPLLGSGDIEIEESRSGSLEMATGETTETEESTETDEDTSDSKIEQKFPKIDHPEDMQEMQNAVENWTLEELKDERNCTMEVRMDEGEAKGITGDKKIK